MLLWLPLAVTTVRCVLLIPPTEPFRAFGLVTKRAVAIPSTTPEHAHQLFVHSADATVRPPESAAG